MYVNVCEGALGRPEEDAVALENKATGGFELPEVGASATKLVTLPFLQPSLSRI